MKIQNYGPGSSDRSGYHPPNCTCYGCNELRQSPVQIPDRPKKPRGTRHPLRVIAALAFFAALVGLAVILVACGALPEPVKTERTVRQSMSAQPDSGITGVPGKGEMAAKYWRQRGTFLTAAPLMPAGDPDNGGAPADRGVGRRVDTQHSPGGGVVWHISS